MVSVDRKNRGGSGESTSLRNAADRYFMGKKRVRLRRARDGVRGEKGIIRRVIIYELQGEKENVPRVYGGGGATGFLPGVEKKGSSCG